MKDCEKVPVVISTRHDWHTANLWPVLTPVQIKKGGERAAAERWYRLGGPRVCGEESQPGGHFW
jgi:hypothetical protein